MLKLIISGGQIGADQAGWRAAKACGIPTGGWMPKGFLTEDGPRPEFAGLYGATEHDSPLYPPRTAANIRDSDFTLIFQFDGMLSRGTVLAKDLCQKHHKPWDIVFHKTGWLPGRFAKQFLESFRINDPGVSWRLNIAGNRESKAPGIGAWVEVYCRELFKLLRAREVDAGGDVAGSK
jgi:hypothetical protein